MTALVQTNSRAIRRRMARKLAGSSRRPVDMRFITRIAGAWWVRVQRIELHVSKLFSDSKFGGNALALAEALLYRDKVLRAAAPARNERKPPGHGYIRRVVIDGREAFEGWVRLEGGRSSRTQWFVDVHGPRRAKRGAEEWLRRHRRALGVAT